MLNSVAILDARLAASEERPKPSSIIDRCICPSQKCNTFMTFEAGMRSDAEWAAEAKRILRSEMVRRGVTYDELAKKLADIGVEQSPPSLRMTINRGRFRAMLLLQCLTAMGCHSLRVTDPEEHR
jgi:hypothetical protein